MIALSKQNLTGIAAVLREKIEGHRAVIAWAVKMQAICGELKVETNDLKELIAFAVVHDDLEAMIVRSRREMVRLSKSCILKEYSSDFCGRGGL